MIKALLLLFTSCGVAAQQKSQVPPDEFELIAVNNGAQLLDVRRPEEYKEGHLKNALQANWQDQSQFKQATLKLDKAKPVYVYCKTGVRSSKAQDWLLENGFKNVINLEGGIEAWKAKGKLVYKE